MKTGGDGMFRRTEIGPYVFILGLVWSLSVGSSLAWNLYQNRQELLEMARTQARVAHEKDVAYRSWNATHSYVYVPVEGENQPNPYLQGPDRDVVTISGKTLTQVNPAYMTRQVHDIESEAYGVRGHITSLEPVRPQNSPDPWEREALKSFKRGTEEVNSVEVIDGETYMRLMRPLSAEKSCLRCHNDQGYEEGDILGGISVSVPMKPLASISRNNRIMLSMTHGALWVLGVVGLAFGTRHVRQRVQERDRAEAALRSANKKLEHLSITDGLTGLYNRRYFMERFEAEHHRSNRYSHGLSLLMIDIDHFKRINDELGHPCGDMVLQEVARVLQANVRSSDIVGRYGGEEISILLPETDIIGAQEAGEKLRRAIENGVFVYHGNPLKVTVSIGVSELGNNETSQHLLTRADQALYRAKNSGRNRTSQ